MQIFQITRNDTSPSIRLSLDGALYNLTGATAVFSMRNAETGAIVVNRASATVDATPSAPSLTYGWDAADTATAGIFDAEFEVTYSDGTVETFFNGADRIRVLIRPDIA